jgi:putative flippase GtrA
VNSTLADRIDADLVTRILRYAGVSVLTVIITLGLLLGGIELLGWEKGLANLVAVTLSSVPNYYLNRSWVWEKTGKSHFWKEIVPFWTYTVIGIILSTAVVAWAATKSDTSIMAVVAQLGTYGVIWVAKFVFLDQLLFGDGGGGDD